MTHLIGLDWGTTNLRAYLFASDGAVLEARQRPYGIRSLPGGGFNAALSEITADWPDSPRLACGMIGARDGWIEMPYLDVPVIPETICSQISSVTANDNRPVHVMPGLRTPQRPDVMRGEETQVIGLIASQGPGHGDATLVLPGTHSKWITLRGNAIVDFRTLMTGEMYSIILKHSIIGAGLNTADAATAPTQARMAFHKGVSAVIESANAGMTSSLFALRAWRLNGDLAEEDVASCLSGMLIAEEIRAVNEDARFDRSAVVHLGGESGLCEAYREVLALFDIETVRSAENLASKGLWDCARRAGLINGAVGAHDG